MSCARLAGNAGPKNRQKVAIWAPSHNFVALYLRNWDTYRQSEKLLNSNISPICPHNMVNFGLLAAEICWRVWGTPANFNGFRVWAALLHGIIVVGVSQTLRRWTKSATYIRQGGHHVGHWPTFLVFNLFIPSFGNMPTDQTGQRISRLMTQTTRKCSQRHCRSVQTELNWSLLRFRQDGTIATEITVPSNFFKFSPTKDLAPFSIHTPQKNPLLNR